MINLRFAPDFVCQYEICHRKLTRFKTPTQNEINLFVLSDCHRPIGLIRPKSRDVTRIKRIETEITPVFVRTTPSEDKKQCLRLLKRLGHDIPIKPLDFSLF